MAKPDFTVKVGAISLAVWTNKSKDQKFDNQSITITRTYKKGDGFETTNSMRFTDLPLIKLAIDEVMKIKYLKEKPLVETSKIKDVPEF